MNQISIDQKVRNNKQNQPQRISKRTLAETWTQLSQWPGGKWLFSKMIGRMAHYSGTVSAYVRELELGRSVVEMKDRKAVRNHLKSVHAIALLNLGELATGLCAMYGIDGRGRGIVKGIRIEYLKKARGTLTAHCSFVAPKEVGTHSVEVEGTIHNTNDEIVARVWVSWKLEIYA